MTEETKQEVAAEVKVEASVEVPKVDAPKPEARVKPAAVVVKRGKGSRPKQCSQCSKNMKKKTWYYRDNRYFCNKRCWKASTVPKPVAA